MAAKGTEDDGATFGDRVVRRLGAWPSVSLARADCGTGMGLRVGRCQVLHLHSPGEAELLLTRPVIERLGDALVASGRVAVQPGGDWVRVSLNTESDVTMVVSLASVAIKAAGDIVGTVHNTPCGAAERRPAGRPAVWRGRPACPLTFR